MSLRENTSPFILVAFAHFKRVVVFIVVFVRLSCHLALSFTASTKSSKLSNRAMASAPSLASTRRFILLSLVPVFNRPEFFKTFAKSFVDIADSLSSIRVLSLVFILPSSDELPASSALSSPALLIPPPLPASLSALVFPDVALGLSNTPIASVTFCDSLLLDPVATSVLDPASPRSPSPC